MHRSRFDILVCFHIVVLGENTSLDFFRQKLHKSIVILSPWYFTCLFSAPVDVGGGMGYSSRGMAAGPPPQPAGGLHGAQSPPPVRSHTRLRAIRSIRPHCPKKLHFLLQNLGKTIVTFFGKEKNNIYEPKFY